MIEHGDAIREAAELRAVLVGLNQMIAQKDRLLEKLKDRDLRRRNENRELRHALNEARHNIGELNSMLHSVDVVTEEELVEARKELRELKESHERQAHTIGTLLTEQEASKKAANLRSMEIADKGSRIRSMETEIAGLKQRVLVTRRLSRMVTAERDKARAQVEELQGRIQEGRYWADEYEDSNAPNLALVACKKKLEQLEGMLEAQRRSTRELGANLQRVRDERTALKLEVNDLDGRLFNVVKERDDYLKQLQELHAKKNRALSLVRRAAAILDPIQVTEVKNPGVDWSATNALLQGIEEGRAPKPDWGAAQFLRTPAKKATPRTDLHQCGGLNGDHRCQNMYLPGQIAHPQRHHCHCGFTWPW